MEIKCTFQAAVTQLVLERESVTIGRANPFLQPDLDLSADILVSRTHARIWLREDRWWIEDLGSKHGTWVNGVKLEYRRQLNDGDVVRVGETELVLGAPPANTRASVPSAELKPAASVRTALNVEDFSPTGESRQASAGSHTQLAGFASALADCDDRESVLRCLGDELDRRFPRAKLWSILLRDGSSSELSTALAKPAEARPASELVVLRSIAEGRALLWRESLDSLSAEGNRRRTGASGLCAPMFRQRRAVGVICLEGSEAEGAFTEADLKLLLGLAGVAALALA